MKLDSYLGYYCGASLTTMMPDFQAMMPGAGHAKIVAQNDCGYWPTRTYSHMV